MSKYIIDANIIINGIFNPISYSRKIINNIKERKIQVHVLQHTLNEVEKVVRRTCILKGVDLLPYYQREISHIPVEILDPPPNNEIITYHHIGGKSDAHIAAAAARYNLSVFTNDDDFFKKDYGFKVHGPVEATLISRNYEITQDLDLIFGGILSSKHEGTLYFDLTEHWKYKKDPRLFCLIDIVGIGVLYIDAPKRKIIFKLDDGPEIGISTSKIPQGEVRQNLVVTYKYNLGISMYLGFSGKVEHRKIKWSPGSLKEPIKVKFGDCRIGESRARGIPISKSGPNIAGFEKYVSHQAANRLLGGKQPVSAVDRITLEELFDYYNKKKFTERFVLVKQ